MLDVYFWFSERAKFWKDLAMFSESITPKKEEPK